MNIDDITKAIVHIPVAMDERKSMSPLALLRETGYFEVHETISEGILQKAIRERPEYIHEWLEYSADKRTKGGPYVQ